MIRGLGGAPATRRKTTVVLPPLTITASVPKEPKPEPPKGFDWRSLPWKWIIAAGIVGSLYVVAKKKRKAALG